MKQEDKDLIGRAREGDRQAFEALLEGCYGMMFRVAYKWCGNRADAEDVTQDAAIKLARAIGGFRGDSAFASWLYRLVVNAAIDWQRTNKRYVELPDPESGHVGTVANSADKGMEVQEELARVLALPEKEKTALLLVFSEGMSHAEAAVVMECKESTVSWYIHEARKKLGVKEMKRSEKHG